MSAQVKEVIIMQKNQNKPIRETAKTVGADKLASW